MSFLTRTIPIVIAFVMGIVMIGQYYVPAQASQDFLRGVALWSRIIGGFAIFLGAYSLFRMHLGRIRQQAQGWGYSAFFFVGAVVTLAAGLYNGGGGPLADLQKGTSFWWLFDYVYTPAGATVFALVGFFIASAAYRTFRARTLESGVLLLTAIIVMLGRVPIGAYISEWIPVTTDWIMSVPNLAVKRAILMGICLGSIATSLKIIFGIERTYLGGGE